MLNQQAYGWEDKHLYIFVSPRGQEIDIPGLRGSTPRFRFGAAKVGHRLRLW